MEKQAAVPHGCDKHKNPAQEKLTKERSHDSSWEQHKGSCVYKAAEVGGLILPWHVHQPHLMSSFHMVLLLDNVKRQMLGSSATFANRALFHPQQGKGPLKNHQNNDAENWHWQRNCLLRPCVTKFDWPALEITILYKYKSPISQLYAPRADSHSSEKLGYEDSALRVSVKKPKQVQKNEAFEELVFSRKWGHLVASYKNVQHEFDFSAKSLTGKSSMKIKMGKSPSENV